MATRSRFSASADDSPDSWISIADLMAVLMMIFLLLAVWHSIEIAKQTEAVRKIVAEWEDLESAICISLKEALFDDDGGKLKEEIKKGEDWDAEIDCRTLTIRFKSDTFFEQGRAELPSSFKTVLDEFFPRYIGALYGYRKNIKEVRIEGHTSSEFGDLEGREAFIPNMELSQDRTRAVMEYVLNLNGVDNLEDWVIKTVTANGLSSGRLLYEDEEEKIEDRIKSRRVEFAVRTTTKEALFDIIEEIDSDAGRSGG